MAGGHGPPNDGQCVKTMDERVDRTEADQVNRETTSPILPTRRRRSRLLWLVLAAIVAIVGLGLWFGLPHRRQPPTAAAPAQPVGAAQVDTGDIRVILSELGTVTPLDTVTVRTQINGQLTEVAFHEGQIVKKGEFLAQIDDRIYQAQLQHDLGQLAHDQGLLEQAQSDLQRFATLGRQNSIAQQQVADQRYLVQQDEGTVAADQGTVATDRTNIAYCHIVSPIDGRVGLRQVDPGNYVQTSDTNGIAVLTQMQPMSVIFSVPQQNVAAIEQRLLQGATLPVFAYDQSNTTEIDQGKLAVIDNQMNTATGTVNLRAIFPNAHNQLFPNQFVNAHLLVDTLTNVVRVPVAAVQAGAPGAFVWVIGPNGTVSDRPVTLGPVDGQFQQVISGLKPGEQVVTDGIDRLQAGMRVTVKTAAAKGTAASKGAAGP